MQTIKKIGILTSGGDAPGMNAAIRAVVRKALNYNLEVVGIQDGFLGMHQELFISLDHSSVDNIIGLGGTILGTARFLEFKEEKIRAEAVQNLKKHNIDAVVIIGGDGSYMGALRLTQMGIPCIGIPGTIDNDTHGTDYTIGFDTALNTIVDCMDKLRDTCNSHKRVSIIEIMGRHCGDLSTYASIAGGADFLIIPERNFNHQELYNQINSSFATGKRHVLIALAENIVNADTLAQDVQKNTNYECRATILGHIQRGGSPTPNDRILASRLGAYAVDLLLQGVQGHSVGVHKNELVHNELKEHYDQTVRSLSNELSLLTKEIA